MKVLSVNVGRPRPNPWKRLLSTGIDKQPVEGPVSVAAPGPKGTGAVGLAGDRAYDVKHHGGDDQAVYAYAREDLDAWQRTMARTFANGSFGENLTTDGIDVNRSLIGERWRIGSAVLEVSCPRIPCLTFAGWLEQLEEREESGGPRESPAPAGRSAGGWSSGGWMKRFTQAALPGPYLRVIEPGEVTAGDAITVLARPDHGVTVAVSFRALTTEPELLPLLVDLAGFPAADRDAIGRRLGRSGTGTA